MFDISILEQYIITFTPVIVAVFGMIATMLKVIKNIKDMKNDIESNTDFNDIKNELKKLTVENRELKRQQRLVLEQLTKVSEYDDKKM